MGNTFLNNNIILVDAIANSDQNGPPLMEFGIRNSAGTAAAPSIVFTGSTTTGLFRKAADSVGFSAAGVEIGSFSSAGGWSFGAASNSDVNHVFRGRASDGVTFFNTLFQSNGTAYQIKFERTTPNAGFSYIGGDGLIAFNVRNQLGLDVLSGTQEGAWTIGRAGVDANVRHWMPFGGAGTTQTILKIGGQTIGAQSGIEIASQNLNSGSGSLALVSAQAIVGNRFNFGYGGIVSGLPAAVVGFFDGTGAWSFGPAAGTSSGTHTMTGTSVASGISDVLTLIQRGAGPSQTGLTFQGQNTAGGTTSYVRISNQISDATSGSETGALIFYTRGSGALTEKGGITGSGAWTLGPDTNYTGGDAARVVRVNHGRVTFRYPTSSVTAHSVGIASDFAMSFESAWTGTGATKIFKFNGTSNEIASATQAGAWTFGPNGFTGAHIFNGVALAIDTFIGSVTNTANFNAGSFRVVGTGLTGKTFIGMDNIGGGGGCGFVCTRDGSAGTGVQVFTNTTGGFAPGGLNTAGPFVSAGGTSWTTPSDERLKDILGPIVGGLDKIMLLTPIIYKMKSDTEDKPCLGLSAQEVQTILPELVIEGPEGYLGVLYSQLTPVLVKAIQELSAQNTALAARLEALELTATPGN